MAIFEAGTKCKPMNKHHYCVIMAGGVGSRFWPLSRSTKPKQFLDILGVGKTLLQSTFDRFSRVIPPENIFIVSNTEYKEIIEDQIPGLNKDNILSEPYRRNTAPCIAYASYRLKKADPEAVIVVAPSDHLILKEDKFLEQVKAGLEFVEAHDALLTLGMEPNKPETGYGYIQVNGEKGIQGNGVTFKKVKTFTEKPDLRLANIFLKSGDFFWNSGIFFWSLNSIIRAIETYLPEISTSFEEGSDAYGTPAEKEFIEQAYSGCKNISIDYGIMEKADNVYVLTTDIGWSDLGTWGSLFDQKEKDQNENALIGDNIFIYDVKDSLVSVSGEKLVVLQGLEGYIVVQSNDILLICRKEEEQRIKSFVNDIKISKGDKFI
jgi:mannose-1-phosphate guanylyltransferase